MKSIVLSVFFLLTVVRCEEADAQLLQQWTARFNGPHDSTDVAKAVTVDNQGNVYVTGYSTSLILITQIATIKYNSAGVQQWEQRYGSILSLLDFSSGYAIALDDSNNVYVAGTTTDVLLISYMVVLKYNTNGVFQWAYTHRGTTFPLGTNIAYSLVVDNLHNVYVTGAVTNGLILGNLDFATIKLNINSVQQWASVYNGPANAEDDAYKIKLDGLNNLIVAGKSTGTGTGFDYAVVKYNNNGVQQWVRRYDGPGHDEDIANDVAVDRLNNVYVTGSSRNGSAPGTEDYATLKYDPNGNQQWVSRYNGSGNGEDRAYAIYVDNSDNPIVTGTSNENNSGQDYNTIKYNSGNGNQVWSSKYNGTGNGEDRAYANYVDNSDNVFVTGESDGTSSGKDYATVKYDPNGNQQSFARYNGTGNNEDRAYAIYVDNSDNVYVTGESRHGSVLGTEDYLTIKYADPVGINIISNNVPQNFNLYQNYPNPFNPSTIIKIDISHISDVRLAIYDVLGNKVNELVNKKLNAGTYEITVNTYNLPSGIYFYRLAADNYSETKKMILLK